MPSFFSRSQQLTKFYSVLDNIIAAIVLCLGIVFMAVSLYMNRPNGVTLSAILLVSSLVYLLLRNRLAGKIELPQISSQNLSRLLSHIVFVVSLSLSIWLLWDNLYYRPPIYFVLCSLAAASIIWDIFILDKTKNSHTAIVLFKIITLSISIYAGIYYQFPGIYGGDPWWHNQWIQETVNLGHITPGQFADNQYFVFPVFHLASATMHIITGLSIYTSVFISISVLMAVSSIFIFLIGRKLVNAQLGLLAALIVFLSSETIFMAASIIPMSLGFCFFSATLYLIFCRDRKRVSDSLLIMLLSVALIFTHTIAALVMLLSLIAIFIGTKLYKKISRHTISYEPVSLTLILFFGAAMLIKWMQPSWRPSSGESFFDFSLSGLLYDFLTSAEFAPTEPLIASTLSPAVSLLDRGGYLLLLCLAIIGALVYLHPKRCTAPRMALVLTLVALIVLPTSFELFGSRAILPHRWYMFLYVPLSILAVQGLSGISSPIRWNVGKIGMVMLVILAAIFMMTTNSSANRDSPLVYNEAKRYTYTKSELTAIRTFTYMGYGSPMTDEDYGGVFLYVIGYDKFRDMLHRENKVFVFRYYYLHHLEWNKYYTTKIGPMLITGWPGSDVKTVVVSNYMNEHEIDNQHLIYINQNVKVYDMPRLDMEP